MGRRIVVAFMATLLSSGCVSVRIGTEEKPSGLEMKGLANGYASVHGIRPYDGALFELGILDQSSRSGEFEAVSLELWPIFALGVGLAGARVQVLPFDLGVGALFYDPDPPSWEGEADAEGEPDGAMDVTPPPPPP